MENSDFSGKSIVEVATIVATHLSECDIKVVVVGGLAVEIYTLNRYQTRDIDLINTSYDRKEVIQEDMKEIGFHKDQDRYYRNTTTDYFIEFPPAPLSIGDNEFITPLEKETNFGTIHILEVDDVIRDRLTWYCINTTDLQSLVQALCVMHAHGKRPDEFMDYMKGQCENENIFSKKSNLLETCFESTGADDDMKAIESVVEDAFIDSLT